MKILRIIIFLLLLVTWGIATILIFPMVIQVLSDEDLTFRSWFDEPKGMYETFIKN